MRGAFELLRTERSARLFFLAHAQSSLGTGAAYVGLLILAYDRLGSAWAISLVLLADFIPAMLFGPVFGAIADRWSRRLCAVAADLMRAGAFIGLALVDSFVGTVAFALLAGSGTGLFTPAVLAGLPSLVGAGRLPAATSLYGAISDVGHMAGPALAAAGLLLVGPEQLMFANGVTFAVSAVLVALVPFGAVPADRRSGERRSLMRDAREGIAATARMSGVRAIIVASAAIVLFAGMFNVGELLLATNELGASNSGFSILVASFGAGVVLGSLIGARGGTHAELKRRYLIGIAVTGVGLTASGLAPVYAVALPAFLAGGIGNGLVLVHERLLLQTTVRDDLMGRVFGLKDSATSWAFALAFLSAGALLELIGTRELLVLAGLGSLFVWLVAWLSLRGTWVDGPMVRREEAAPGALGQADAPAAAAERAASAEAR